MDLIWKAAEKIELAKLDGFDDLIEDIARKLDQNPSVPSLERLYMAVSWLQIVNDHTEAGQGDIGPAVYAFYRLARRSEWRGLSPDVRGFVSGMLREHEKVTNQQ